MASRSPSSTALLPMPGATSSSWALFRARAHRLLRQSELKILVAFWLFGFINNVNYVMILSAAQDLVGTLPKGIVLLSNVVPGLFVKLVGPYCVDRVPYPVRVVLVILSAVSGMLLVALSPPSWPVAAKMAGVSLASVSGGGGDVTFLGLAHHYGPWSVVGWGSGTGAAGLIGAGMYVVMTDWWALSVSDSLLFSACLPVLMLVSYFLVLPRGSHCSSVPRGKGYETISEGAEERDDGASTGTLAGPRTSPDQAVQGRSRLSCCLARVKPLLVPYIAPLVVVYVAEYTINQGVAPTLLYPVASSPFKELRDFYPFYSFLYQLGVFISRSSTPFVRIRRVWIPSLLQVGNLVGLVLEAVFSWVPSVYLLFLFIFWEGLLGGAVYVNTFADIMETVPEAEREFSLSVTSVSDSTGICIAGLVSIATEKGLCSYQVAHGRDWCRKVKVQQL